MRYLSLKEDYTKLSLFCFKFFQDKHGHKGQKFQIQKIDDSHLLILNVYSEFDVLNFSYLLYIVDSDDFPETFKFTSEEVKILNTVNPPPNSGKRVLLTAVNEKFEPFNDKYYNLTPEIEMQFD